MLKSQRECSLTAISNSRLLPRAARGLERSGFTAYCKLCLPDRLTDHAISENVFHLPAFVASLRTITFANPSEIVSSPRGLYQIRGRASDRIEFGIHQEDQIHPGDSAYDTIQ